MMVAISFAVLCYFPILPSKFSDISFQAESFVNKGVGESDKSWLKYTAEEVGLPDTATREDVNAEEEKISQGFLWSRETWTKPYCQGKEFAKRGERDWIYCIMFLSRRPSSQAVSEVLLEEFHKRFIGANGVKIESSSKFFDDEKFLEEGGVFGK